MATTSSCRIVDFPEAPPARAPRLSAEGGEDASFVFAASPAAEGLRAQVECVAGVDLPVLILGERSVGKRALARLIHRLSSRSHRALRSLNCAALTSELLEGELFGSEAGAAAGPVLPKPGMLALANKGTLLLEEIGGMPRAAQARLWQALRDRQLTRRQGAPLTLDVRVLATLSVESRGAGPRSSARRVKDLDNRLPVLTIVLPPLRDRQDEMPHLLKHFLRDAALRMGVAPKPLTAQVVDACCSYDWPGNLQELKAFAVRYLALDGDEGVLRELSQKRACPARPVKEPAKSALPPVSPLGRARQTSFWLDLTPAAPPAPWNLQGIPIAGVFPTRKPKWSAKTRAGNRLMTFPEQFGVKAGAARRGEMLNPGVGPTPSLPDHIPPYL